MSDYLLQEDGTSHIDLEDLSGDLLLETSTTPIPGGTGVWSVGGQVFRG